MRAVRGARGALSTLSGPRHCVESPRTSVLRPAAGLRARDGGRKGAPAAAGARGSSPAPGPSRVLSHREFSKLTDAARAEGLARFAVVLERAGRAKVRGPQTADAVWDAYSALGSARGLAAAQIDDAVHFLTVHANHVESQARRSRLRDAEADANTAALLEEAAWRTRTLLADAAQAGLAVSETALLRLVQTSAPTLTTFSACLSLSHFIRTECGAPLTVPIVNRLLHAPAHAGNYTAFLRLLHGAFSADGALPPTHVTLNVFLSAVAEASEAKSEDLKGYRRGAHDAADLAIPAWSVGKDRAQFRFQNPDTHIPDRFETDADPAGSLREYLAAQKAPIPFLELCRPWMQRGRFTPARKALRILAYAVGQHREGRTDALSPGMLTSLVRALAMWGHPRLARAAVDVLTAEPYSIMPDVATVEVLLRDAGLRRNADDAASVAELARRLGFPPTAAFLNSVIHAYSAAGRIEKVMGAIEEFAKAGIRPDEATGMGLIEATFAANPALSAEGAEKALLAMRESLTVTVRHWNKAMSLLAQKGDLAEVVAMRRRMPPDLAPTDVTLDILLGAHAKAGDTTGCLEAMKEHPEELLGLKDTWFAALEGLAKGLDKAAGVGDAFYALARAVLDRKVINTADLPESAADVPFAGLRPPPLDDALLAKILDWARGFLPDDPRKYSLEDRGRELLARRGVDPEGLDGQGLYRAAKRLAVLGPPRGERRRGRAGERAEPREMWQKARPRY